MNAPTVTALATAIVALIGAIFAIFKWQTERAQWQKTFEKSVTDWQVQFLHDLVTRRVETYPAILRTLAAVRDVPDKDHLGAVRDHPERLLAASDCLNRRCRTGRSRPRFSRISPLRGAFLVSHGGIEVRVGVTGCGRGNFLPC